MFVCYVYLFIASLLVMNIVVILLFFFFFKQKTAYEMRISDWSSDVCSSDLPPVDHGHAHGQLRARLDRDAAVLAGKEGRPQQVGDHAGVVQRAALAAVLLLVEAFVEIEHRRRRRAGAIAERPQGLDPGPRHQRLMRDRKSTRLNSSH